MPRTAPPAGGRSWARFGTSVSGADDFNGDGYNDVAVGAPGWSGREPDQGAVFLYLGMPGGLSTVATWAPTSDLVVKRNQSVMAYMPAKKHANRKNVSDHVWYRSL